MPTVTARRLVAGSAAHFPNYTWALGQNRRLVLEFATGATELLHHSFASSGPTSNAAIPTCSSLPDYLGQWLALTFSGDAVEDATERTEA